jgi:long-chain acyl-CoA synthetase
MDVTPFLELKIAPRAVFDSLPERASRVRFHTTRGDVTWADFATMIRRFACFLHGEIAAGDRVAVFASNRVEWIAAALGIQAAGGVLVPIYPASTADQAAYVVEHADARIVCCDAATRARVPAAARTVSFEDEWTNALALGATRDAADPDAFTRRMHAVSLEQPGLMLYTSGTSGNPKGVPLTHRNVAQNGLDWLTCLQPLLPDDGEDLLWLPMSHIFGLGEACIGNTLGWTTTLVEPQHVLARLPEVRPNVFMSVPSVWEKLAAAPSLAEATGGRLRFCLSGGAGLKREVKERFHAQGLLIIEGYGLTECSPTLTMNRPDAFRFDTVGKPFPSVELRLAEDGEILARGPSVFGGYHKDPAATREAFTEDGWFKTGDVGQLTDEGFLRIVDRKKDILVTAGGKNVPPANIELRFADDPLFAHVVVYGEGKRYLVAGVWLNATQLDGDALHAAVQERVDTINAGLASYETIKRFAIMSEPLSVTGGLLTATLKVRRKKVYEAFRGAFEALYS